MSYHGPGQVIMGPQQPRPKMQRHVPSPPPRMGLGRVGPEASSQPPPDPIEPEAAAMAVVARMYVAEIHTFAYNPGQRQVVLRAVSRGEENKSWAQATPSAECNMHINNPDAAEWFAERLGEDVLVHFSAAPKAGPSTD